MPSTDFHSASIPQIQERFQEQLRLAQFGKGCRTTGTRGGAPPMMSTQLPGPSSQSGTKHHFVIGHLDSRPGVI